MIDGRARDRATLVVMALALTAAVVRIIPLQWLHPLNWDELEFWQATRWIAEGRLPYRDYWEHHTPLQWFVFAPVTLLSSSPGVEAVILLRWAQVPVWIATFYFTNSWMRGAGLGAFARWAAMCAALSSSMLMIPAVEYRVDALGCMLVMGGLLLAQRKHFFSAGIIFCLAAFANLRLGPMLVVAFVAIMVGTRFKAYAIAIGGTATLLVCLTFFGLTGSLEPLAQQVWTDNLAERFATPVETGFIHRLAVPFGVRLIATDRLFELAAVDVGGVIVLVAGFVALVVVLLRWRERSPLLLIAAIQLGNVAFVASMKFIYNYHLTLVVILMIPLVASLFERIRARPAIVAALVLACGVTIFASIFRGKEHDRAYQDLIMREADARTLPGDRVWSGIPWALQREPAYRFWFLPELARQLVRNDLAPRLELRDVLAAPPAAIVLDYNALLWLGTVQPELLPFFGRHYAPVWRELWVPALNGRIDAGSRLEWTVPRDGLYRLHASAQLAGHPWFRQPLLVTSYKRPDASRFTVALPEPGAHPSLVWEVDGRGARIGESVMLRRGQRVAVTSLGGPPLGIFLLSSDDRQLFRQPPPGVTLEGETTRVTHVPQIGARIAR